MVNIRKIAYFVLKRVLKDNAYSVLTLNSEIIRNNLDNRDSSLLSAIVYGVLERKLLLDYIIFEYSSVNKNKIDFETLLILEISLYQLLYLDKIPDRAVVDEAVKLSKKLHLYRSSGFINGLLRNIIRNNKEYIEPTNMSIKYSIDENIFKILLDAYGENNTTNILEAIQGRPPLFIRVNTLKTNKLELIEKLKNEGVSSKENSIIENCLVIENTGSLEKLQSFKEGMFFVQDLSSQICSEVLECKENDILCDVCAAPGGKSINSAINMQNKGKIYSFDIHQNKLKLIEDSCNRLGISIIETSLRDAAAKNASLPYCNKVLCDVPCSGLGILRRKPEIRYNKVTNIDLLPQLQYDILCINGEVCPINCDLVYSTCTLNPDENIKVVEKFLGNHPNFETVDINLPKNFKRFISEPSYALTILPTLDGGDGFFMAKLRKVSTC